MNLAFAFIPLSLAFQAAVLDVPKPLLKTVPAVNQTMAKVNGVEIKMADVEVLLWEWRKNDVLNDLITYQIVKDAAAKESVKVTDDEAQAETKRLIDGIGQTLPAGQTIEQAMEQEGTAPSRLYIRVKTEMLLRKLILKDFAPADYVKISTIVFKPASTSTEDIKVATDRAQRAYLRLKGGEAWDEVLLSVTDDPRARAALGSVGWRAKRLFPEATQAEMAKLTKGGITQPSTTANGIQIFRIDALGSSATAEEKLELEESYFAGQRQSTMTKLRAEAKVERF
jgi:parvulin-like peptidyl-prolyl isomerase